MGTTPVYGFPYAELPDPPNGPIQQQGLAEAVETELVRVEGREVVAYPRITPTGPGSAAIFTGTVSTDYVLASQAIADPGFPYFVEAACGLFLSGMTDPEGGVSHALYLILDSTTPDAPTTIGSRFVGQTNGTFSNAELGRRRYPSALTGAHTVNMVLALNTQGPATWGPLNTRFDYYFDVYAVPA